MSARGGIQPIGSSVDVGWQDGQPRPVTEDTSRYLAGQRPRVQEEEKEGRIPRPRSKNAPKPAMLVDYGQVARNTNDNIDLAGPSIDKLMMTNAENMKQFQYLEQSLVTFQDAVSQQVAELRQPAATVRGQVNKALDLADTTVADDKEILTNAKAKRAGAAIPSHQQVGAPPVFADVLVGRSDAMLPLGNVYAEGDPAYEDKHLQPLDPIIVEGEGYLYGVRSIQVVALKEIVRGNDFIAVSSGPNHSIGITATGQAFTWGANNMQQLGYSGAEEGILGLDMDPRPVAALHGKIVIDAACGKLHTLALTEDGQIWSWGAYAFGQLGHGEVAKEKYPHGYMEPMQILGLETEAPRTLACGYFHSVICDGLGDLFSFGTGDHGAHGHDSQFDVSSPQLLQTIKGKDFRQVSCGAAHTVALSASGELWVWGLNDFGQLGLGSRDPSVPHPTQLDQVQGLNIRRVACGATHTVLLSDRNLFTFGDGTHGALGHGNSKSHLQPKVVIKLTEDCRLRDIAAGPQFSVAISDLGQLYFWGNMKSTSGRGAKHVYNMPRRFKGLEAIYGVACGEHEISALVRIPVAPPLDHKFKAGVLLEEADSGIVEGFIGRACTWGKATDGKLGHGTGKMTQADLKSPFSIYGPLYLYSITSVACGADHTACVTDNGKIFCWGSNKEGQLGTRDFKARHQPTMLVSCRDPDVARLKNANNKKFKDVVVGDWHCLAVTTKKKVYAWGKNKYGQLGLGHTNNMNIATCILPLSDPFMPKNVRCVAAAKSHSAVVVEDGDIYTWGRGWDGQLGHEVITEIELEPRIVPVMENKSSAAVACGRAHTVAMTDNGNVWTWGDNKAGQLGIGSLVSTPKPVIVSSLDEQEVTSIACGDEHTICITIANEVYGFGNGVWDQLGLGTLGIFPKPQRIPGLTKVPRIRGLACGAYSTGVIGGDNTAYLLGRWDGISKSVQSIASRTSAVRRTTKGTLPDVLQTPLGIHEVRYIAMGPEHGCVIGLEEDKQRLIQRRIDEERAAILESMEQGEGEDPAVSCCKVTLRGGLQATLNQLDSAAQHAHEQQRKQVVPYFKYTHGGEPFPDEIDEIQRKMKEPSDRLGAEQDQEYLHTISAELEEEDDETNPGSVSGGVGAEKSLADDTQSQTSKATHTTAQSQGAEARAAMVSEDMSRIPQGYHGYLVAWGNNGYGQCAVFSRGSHDKDKPVKNTKDKVGVSPSLSADHILPSISNVSCGEHHTLAVGQDGTLWSWGRNNMGQLGHGDTKGHSHPRRVEALEKKICIRVAAGGQHSMVLTEANKVYSWGSNSFGQLGMGLRDEGVMAGRKEKMSSTPDIIATLRRSGVCHIVCGYSHSVALLKTEQIYAWGRNDCGQLGLGHYQHSGVPEHVTTFRQLQVQQIACGYDHCVAFVAEHMGDNAPPIEKVYSWGRGEEGQLGHDDKYSRCVPKAINTLKARGIRAIAAGGFGSVAIDEAKQVYTWGDSSDGQLGHGDNISLNGPQIMKVPLSEDKEKPDFRGTFRARTVVVGPSYMLAMGLEEEQEKESDPNNAGTALNKYAWGCNSHGQLGMPFLNARKRKTGQVKMAPERIPFLGRWEIKEMACGLQHVVAIVKLKAEGTKRPGHHHHHKKHKGEELTLESLRDDLQKLADGEDEEDHGMDGEDEEKQREVEVKRKVKAAPVTQAMVAVEDEEPVVGMAEDDPARIAEELRPPRHIYDRNQPVKKLLLRLGLPESYAVAFDDASVVFDEFLTMSDADLLEIGIDHLGARRRILRAIQALRDASPMPWEGMPQQELRQQAEAVAATTGKDIDELMANPEDLLPEYTADAYEGLHKLDPRFPEHLSDFRSPAQLDINGARMDRIAEDQGLYTDHQIAGNPANAHYYAQPQQQRYQQPMAAPYNGMNGGMNGGYRTSVEGSVGQSTMMASPYGAGMAPMPVEPTSDHSPPLHAHTNGGYHTANSHSTANGGGASGTWGKSFESPLDNIQFPTFGLFGGNSNDPHNRG